MIVDLKDSYEIRSNRESGFGRYDILMIPRRTNGHGIIIEFKTMNTDQEKKLEDTCVNALVQIHEKNYLSELLDRQIPRHNIYVYGFAFKGKKLLIRGDAEEKIDWTSLSSKH